MELTDQQKHQVCTILSFGCDRLAAAKFAGCSLSDLRRAMRDDPKFAADLRRAEAAIEMTHMRNVQNAAREDKHWRASVWWLERRAPERYGRRDPGAVTTGQLEAFIAQLVGAVIDEVHDAEDRQRLLARFHRVAKSLGQMRSQAEHTQPPSSHGHPRHPPTDEDAPGADDDARDPDEEC